MPNPISDVLWWINSEVNKLSGRGFARVHSVLKEAQSELQRDLQKARWLGTDDRYTAQVHRNALAQINGALKKINNRLSPEMADIMRQNGHAAGVMATNHLAQEVAQFSSIFEGTVRPIALEATTVIAQGDRLLWPRYKTSAARYAGQIGDDIRRQLAIGLVRGETVDQMVRRLAAHGGPKGLVFVRGKEGDPKARAEMISEGLFKRYRSWAERLVRTETVNAYNEAALIGMDQLEKDDPGYFKRWDAAVDGRLCILCRYFDDLVVPLHERFPLGFDKPPRHPNCRCAVVIWRKEWDEVDVRDNIAAEVKRGKKLGTVASVPHQFDLPRVRRQKRSQEEIQQAKLVQKAQRDARQMAREHREAEREAIKMNRLVVRMEQQRDARLQREERKRQRKK